MLDHLFTSCGGSVKPSGRSKNGEDHRGEPMIGKVHLQGIDENLEGQDCSCLG